MLTTRPGRHYPQRRVPVVTAAVLLALGFLVPTGSWASSPETRLSISPAGAPETVYRWTTQKCEREFIPDSPARAIRRWDGQVMLMATHRENWSLVGDTLLEARPVCKSLLRTSEVSERAGTGMLWIQGLHTANGRDVIALVSEDRAQITKARGCDSSRGPGACWLNNMLAAVSRDGGQTFTLLEPSQREVASLGTSYPTTATSRFGAFTASNIVTFNQTPFAMVWIDGGPAKRGNCLIKLNDPFNVGTWQAWNGVEFVRESPKSGLAAACRPLPDLPNEVRSLTLHRKSGVWIAVFQSRRKLPGDPRPIPGFYFSTSSDLKRWSEPQRIMASPTVPREEQREFFTAYPSLIDPESRSRNFDTIDGDRPRLLFTVHNLKNGQGTYNRDLVSIPLMISSKR